MLTLDTPFILSLPPDICCDYLADHGASWDDLLRLVLEAPDSDSARLTAAEWLRREGQGDRAEFIEVQCRLAELDTLLGMAWRSDHQILDSRPVFREILRRERELLDRHALDWSDTLMDAVDLPAMQVLGSNDYGYENCCWSFRRGFVESIALPCDLFLSHAASIFACQPVTTVRLLDAISAREYGGGDESWACYKQYLGQELWQALSSLAYDPHSCWHAHWVERRDRAELELILSAAAVHYGRAAAGLRPLSPERSN